MLNKVSRVQSSSSFLLVAELCLYGLVGLLLATANKIPCPEGDSEGCV